MVWSFRCMNRNLGNAYMTLVAMGLRMRVLKNLVGLNLCLMKTVLFSKSFNSLEIRELY